MKKINWIGTKGNKIELRATCKTYMRETEHNLDGWVVKGKPEPQTEANLELWVDGKRVDDCSNINFWQIIDTRQGIKKVWGLNVGMSDEQAIKVETFLKGVIESGKDEEVKIYENAEAEKENLKKIEQAKKVIEAAKTTRKNEDGTLMTREQAKTWQKRYNDINNEGGEGYVPSVITQEQYDWAKKVLNDEEKPEDTVTDKTGSAVYPEDCKYHVPAEIVLEDDEVSVIFEKDDNFREIVKGLGYTWFSNKWRRGITPKSGTAADRAAELGNKLLNAGFPISVLDADIRRKAIEADYEPECDRWILHRYKGDYEGWLAITWNGMDDELYQKARRLTGSRWSKPSVVVKAEYWQEVEDFANLLGFRFSESARERIEEVKAIKESAKVVVPAEPKEIEQKDGLKDILKSGSDIIDDLKD